MANIFDKLHVTINTKGHKVLSWSFFSLIDVPQNATVQVQWARAGGTWQTLATNLNLSCCYTDTRRTNKNKFNNDFYRIKLTTVEGQQYISQPQQAGINLSYPYSAEAKNLLRLADLEAKQTGRQGKLLKKIVYGQKCPVCQHFQDDLPVNQHCPQCLGTGKKGGYYPAIELNIIQQSQQQHQSLQQFGSMHNVSINAKCIAWPLIQKGDVWVDINNNQRFVIDTIGIISKYKHVPLMCMLQMHKLEQTDILHKENIDPLLNVEDILQSTKVEINIKHEQEWSRVFQE